MLKFIEDNDLIVTKEHIKNKILKEMSKEKKLINCRFITISQLKKNLFKTPDKKALYSLMKKYNLKYSIAKEYLDNINLKTKEIIPYHNYLNDEKLLIKNNQFNPSRILVIGYDHIEPYLLNELKKYDVKYIREKKENYIHKIHEFKTETDEIVYVLTKIIKDLEKTDIKNMYLVIPNEEYLIELSRLSKLFNIPLNVKSSQSIYSTKTAREFIETLKKTKNIELSLKQIPQNDIYNAIVDIVNKHNYIEEIDKTIIEIIENEIKNTKIKKEEINGALKVINIDEVFDKEKYYYILGINQNIIPKIYEESGIINDEEKNALGLFTSKDLNKNEKEKITKILTNYPNIYASYKLKDNFNSYYPSSIISELNLKVEKNNNINYNYSNKYNKILLSTLLDDYINYNEKDERIEKLYSNYPQLEYKEYNNKFTGISKNKITKLLNNTLTLSYTSMNNYFLCPFKFYIQNILKLNKNEETFPIMIGNIFHYVLQNLYTSSFDLDTYYTNYLKDIILTPKETFFLNKLKATLKQDIEVINMQDSYTKFQKKYTEKKISIKKTTNIDTTFTGIIDKISTLDNYVIITDYKTGNIETNLDNITDGLNLQLPSYIYLIKNGYEKDKQIVGFYLQKLLNSQTVDGKEDEIKNNLKLNGYTIDSEEIIEKIDNTYEDSKIIKGMKKTKTGFYSYTKLINANEINKIEKIVDKNIEKVIKAVEKADFKINPKKLNNKMISCEYCKFKDLCYYKQEDITILSPKPFKEIVGDKDAKLD